MNSVQKEMIKLYAKQLKVPTFNHYEKSYGSYQLMTVMSNS